MIFDDPLFIIAIFVPFAAFSIIDRGLRIPFVIRFGFVFGLSIVYYWYGPAASPTLLAAYVGGNYLLLRFVGRSPPILIAIALANIVALFIIKGVMPNGAPLGISFHAFQLAGLFVALVQNSLMEVSGSAYFLFLTFFPQLVAGPIVHWKRAHRFFEHWQVQSRRQIRLDYILLFLSIGLAKKALISDSLYPAVTHFQGAGSAFSGPDALVFPFLYSIYLYMDFSAYSDIATGTALMIGMRMPVNFFSPYKATEPALFWRRWHRTLYKFLRNDLHFLYHWFGLPGGTAFLLFVFLFSGYWHGAAWGYMIWAMGHFLYFRVFPRHFARRLPVPIRVLSNFLVVSILWVPFALGAEGLSRWGRGAWNGIFQAGGSVGGLSIGSTELELTIVGIAMVLLAPNGFQLMRSSELWPVKRAFATILIVLSLHKVLSSAGTPPPFVYFQF